MFTQKLSTIKNINDYMFYFFALFNLGYLLLGLDYVDCPKTENKETEYSAVV